MSNEVLNIVILEALITGIATGVIGTLVMDLFNFLFTRIGLITKIDISMIGRMTAGWLNGRFFYSNPAEMKQVRNEKFVGIVSHYAIGISLAIPYLLFWNLFIGGPVSVTWAITYGILTTVASWFFVYPSMGLGVCGLKSPEKMKATYSSLINHLFFGIGMAVAIAII
jgi:hypothetical protein